MLPPLNERVQSLSDTENDGLPKEYTVNEEPINESPLLAVQRDIATKIANSLLNDNDIWNTNNLFFSDSDQSFMHSCQTAPISTEAVLKQQLSSEKLPISSYNNDIIEIKKSSNVVTPIHAAGMSPDVVTLFTEAFSIIKWKKSNPGNQENKKNNVRLEEILLCLKQKEYSGEKINWLCMEGKTNLLHCALTKRKYRAAVYVLTYCHELAFEPIYVSNASSIKKDGMPLDRILQNIKTQYNYKKGFLNNKKHISSDVILLVHILKVLIRFSQLNGSSYQTKAVELLNSCDDEKWIEIKHIIKACRTQAQKFLSGTIPSNELINGSKHLWDQYKRAYITEDTLLSPELPYSESVAYPPNLHEPEKRHHKPLFHKKS